MTNCEHRVRALFWSDPCGFAVINAFAFIKVRECTRYLCFMCQLRLVSIGA